MNCTEVCFMQMHACQPAGAVKLQGSPVVSVKGHAAAVTGVTLAKRAAGSFVVSTSTDMMLKVESAAILGVLVIECKPTVPSCCIMPLRSIVAFHVAGMEYCSRLGGRCRRLSSSAIISCGVST